MTQQQPRYRSSFGSSFPFVCSFGQPFQYFQSAQDMWNAVKYRAEESGMLNNKARLMLAATPETTRGAAVEATMLLSTMKLTTESPTGM